MQFAFVLLCCCIAHTASQSAVSCIFGVMGQKYSIFCPSQIKFFIESSFAISTHLPATQLAGQSKTFTLFFTIYGVNAL